MSKKQGQATLQDILIVDDTVANLDILSSLLSDAGYSVRAAPLPELALQSALARPPELILLDVRMPKMDGFEFCQRLKQDKRMANVPVIFISALQELSDRVRAFEVGGVDFIIKPFRREELLARVSVHLELKLLRDDLEKRVENRTRELSKNNEMLKLEIIERKAAEEALKSSKQMLSEAQRIARIGNWHWDVKADTLTWSEETYRIFGFQEQQLGLTYDTFLTAVHPDDRDRVNEATMSALSNGTRYSIDHRILLPGGDERFVHEEGEVFFDGENTVRMSGMVQDITERVESQKMIQHSHEQLRALVEHMHSVREEEQKRIARDIHDDLGQLLTAMNINISSIEDMLADDQQEMHAKVQEASIFVSTAINKVQEVAAGLRPMLLDDLGIIAAISWQINRFQERTGLRSSFVSGSDEMGLSDHVATEIFRICQEALTNVARHAEATEVKVSLTDSGGRGTLKVEDNGRGVCEQEINDARSIGFVGIRERPHSIKGRVEICGRPGEGTSIIIDFPIGGESD